MKKLNLVLLVVTILIAFVLPTFSADIDPNSIPASVQTDRNTGFIAMGTQTYATNKASDAVNIGQYLPENCTSGRVYVYGGEAVFGYSDLDVDTSEVPEGYTVANGGYFEIQGKRPYEAYTLYADVAGAATGPISLVIVPMGE